MKKENLVVLLFLVLVFGSLSYCHFRKGTAGSEEFAEEIEDVQSPQSSKKKTPAPLPPVQDTPEKTEAGFLPTHMEDPQRLEAVNKNLQEMSRCLGMPIGMIGPQDEFNVDALLKTISRDLGDIVIRSDEWFATDLRTPQGEIRRIHVQSGGIDPDAPKILNYYSMSGGTQKIIPLSSDQTVNPTDTLLASLEGDGTVISRSRSQRIYFENGDNLLTVEKDGQMYSFQLPHDGKVFSCTGLDASKTIRCVCR